MVGRLNVPYAFGRHDGQGRDEHLFPRTNASVVVAGRALPHFVSVSAHPQGWKRGNGNTSTFLAEARKLVGCAIREGGWQRRTLPRQR